VRSRRSEPQRNFDTSIKKEGERKMIIDVHRLMVAEDTVQAFKNRETDIHFTDQEIDLILGEAARKVLKL
jgi:hypothetical protein